MHVTLNRTSSRYIYEELLGNALGNHRMQDLYIHCAQEARKHIVRTISVLAATMRLRTVHLNTRHSRGTRRQALFGWIAFAFFSRLSASSVLNLVMVVEALTLDDIALMDQVINSSNPIQALLQSEEVGHRTAVLLENVKIELDPPMTLVKGMRVWVIDDKPGSSVLTAMIPGVGVYHLCRSLVSTSPEADGWTKITHFDITLKADSPTNSDGLLALLGIIGSQLISLSITIKSSSHTITSHDISHVLHACPQLEHLDLHNVQVENLDTFVDAYDRHNCRIRVLQLRKLRVTIHTGMTRFFTALSDSTNRMT